MPVRVLVCDDDEPFRALLRHALDGVAAHVVAEAPDAAGVGPAATATRPDAALIDLELPGGAAAAVAAVRAAVPHARVIVCSAHTADRVARAAEELGADGWVLKVEGPIAVRAAVAGDAAA